MIFLTGASGFLGNKILAKLVETKESVRCISRKFLPNSENVEWVRLDLLESRIPNDLLDGCSCVIHCAGIIKGSKRDLNKVNCILTQKLLRLSHKAGVKKFVFISSIDTLLFDSEYAKSKKLAEEVVTRSKMDWIVIRPSQIFGLDDNKNFALLNKLVKMLPIIPIPFGGKFKWEPVSVDDLAAYIVNLVLNNSVRNEELNVVGPEAISFYDIVCQLEKFNDVNRLKIFVPGFVVGLLRWAAGIILGTRKSNEIFSPFTNKIVPEHARGTKIRLTTKFAQVFERSKRC